MSGRTCISSSVLSFFSVVCWVCGGLQHHYFTLRVCKENAVVHSFDKRRCIHEFDCVCI